ncbi:MAG: serine/threonine protein kinase [Actinobacteria bacterium]|nr:MAG: serine/threonine protein kinase [Actinomycetota bacterium]
MVGEIVAERYELEELVGHGGMSSVYRAHDSLLERYVALKVLHEQYNEDDDFVERFKREARLVAQLQHPNIVTVIDRGEQAGRQYIVFEYIEGENLKELVVRRGRLEVREALEIAIEVARALGFAHEHGLVHRDVKPQNVLLNGDGRAKVTDFGIARSLDVEQGVTQTGTVLGTSNYIAPEQASGKHVDQHSDVYSLGVVLYEMLTGQLPFPGESFVAVALKHVNEPPPSVLDVRGDIPIRVAEAVDRALEKEPERRFPTMDAFAAELDACLGELDRGGDGAVTMVVPAKQRLARPPARRSVPRLPLGIGMIALVAIAGIVVGLLTLGGTKGQNKSSAGSPVSLTGVGAYDPYGDGTEHDSAAPKATDGNLASYWYTETYHDAPSLGKPGVGLVLDALAPTQVSRIVLRTDTPGFTAYIRATNILGGPSQPISDTKVVGSRTVFDVRNSSGPKRYYIIWISRLPSDSNFAHVNEVRAFGD